MIPGRHYGCRSLRHPDSLRGRHHGQQLALDPLGPQEPGERGPRQAVLVAQAAQSPDVRQEGEAQPALGRDRGELKGQAGEP